MVDITAHVNFSDLKKWAEDHGMKCLGYTPQWAFLGGLDPDETMQRVFGQVDPFSPVLAGIKALIFPHAMGESHKVMVLSKGMEDVDTVKGFRIRDYKDQLT
jgi:SAM-dependent MidA family methyltransferase